MIKGTTQTLLFNGDNYAPTQGEQIEDTFSATFPFGKDESRDHEKAESQHWNASNITCVYLFLK